MINVPLSHVASVTGVSLRTLQDWLRPYVTTHRTREGYPVDLLTDVLQQHAIDIDPDRLAHTTARRVTRSRAQLHAQTEIPTDAIVRAVHETAREQHALLIKLIEEQAALRANIARMRADVTRPSALPSPPPQKNRPWWRFWEVRD